MRILLILLSLILTGCQQESKWENLEKFHLFEKIPENFETMNYDELIHHNDVKELKVNIIRQRLNNSKYEGKKYGWKGSSYYGIAYFRTGEFYKLKISSIYGVYLVMDTGKYHSIVGFSTIGSMNWKQLMTNN